MTGFGSLIRATRSHINKSSNRSACRDISGRRMRDVRAEKKYVAIYPVMFGVTS